jgi:putative membrane protein
VAFVNQDKGGWNDGEYKNIGLDLEKELHTDHNMKWVFASLNEANQGLQSKKYYSYVWVPENFTKTILSVDGEDPQKAKITLKTREASNVISARIVNRVAYEISQKLGHKTTEEYLNNIFIESRNSADDLGKAVDGAEDLKNGLNDAQQGSQDLENGLNDAHEGGEDLARGLNDAYLGGNDLQLNLLKAYQGASTLSAGIKKLHDGSVTLSENLSTAYAGVKQLSSGARTASEGAATILSGTKLLAAGSGQITAGLKAAAAGANTLDLGINSIKTPLVSLQQAAIGASQYADAVSGQTGNIDDEVNDVNDDLKAIVEKYPELADEDQYKDAVDKAAQIKTNAAAAVKTTTKLKATTDGIQSGLVSLISGAPALISGADQLNAALAQLVAGSQNITSKLGDLQAGEQQLVNGLETLVDGEDSLKDGLYQLDQGGKKLSSKLNEAWDGSKTLAQGLSELHEGSQTLLSGLWSLKDGGDKLVNGLYDLSNGSDDLTKGLADAQSGSDELYQKLNDGYEKNKEKVAAAKTDKEKPVMADPVAFNEEMVDPVKTYGTGFTPYFVPLSLWVGAMAIFLIVPIMGNNELRKRHLPRILGEVTGRYLWLALIGVVQAVVLCTILIKALGLQVNHLLTFYLFTITLALLSIAIFQFLTYTFGLAGDFIGVVVLMLQLTSSGGSYPKETLPPFFVKVGPYLPMTYAVSAFRDIISGGQIDISQTFNIFIIAILLLILLTSVFKWIFAGGPGLIKENLATAVGPIRIPPALQHNPLNRLRIANLKLKHNFNMALGCKLKEIKGMRVNTRQRMRGRVSRIRSRFSQKFNTWKNLRNRRS